MAIPHWGRCKIAAIASFILAAAQLVSGFTNIEVNPAFDSVESRSLTKRQTLTVQTYNFDNLPTPDGLRDPSNLFSPLSPSQGGSDGIADGLVWEAGSWIVNTSIWSLPESSSPNALFVQVGEEVGATYRPILNGTGMQLSVRSLTCVSFESQQEISTLQLYGKTSDQDPYSFDEGDYVWSATVSCAPSWGSIPYLNAIPPSPQFIPPVDIITFGQATGIPFYTAIIDDIVVSYYP